MSFNVVFVLANEQKTTLLQIARGLKRIDPKYRFESGEYFVYNNELYGQIEINRPGDGIFEGDIRRFQAMVEGLSDNLNAARVLKVLQAATGLFFMRVLWEERDQETTMQRYKPLFDWFFENREGVLFVDHEGFYDKDDLLVPVE